MNEQRKPRELTKTTTRRRRVDQIKPTKRKRKEGRRMPDGLPKERKRKTKDLSLLFDIGRGFGFFLSLLPSFLHFYSIGWMDGWDPDGWSSKTTKRDQSKKSKIKCVCVSPSQQVEKFLFIFFLFVLFFLFSKR
jgi:hypothetical protein